MIAIAGGIRNYDYLRYIKRDIAKYDGVFQSYRSHANLLEKVFKLFGILFSTSSSWENMQNFPPNSSVVGPTDLARSLIGADLLGMENGQGKGLFEEFSSSLLWTVLSVPFYSGIQHIFIKI